MHFSEGQDVRLKNYRARNSTTLRSGGNSASSRFSWRKVWNSVKCNFSSAHHQDRNIVWKLSIRQVRMWNFTRIGPKTKKLWLSINPARRPLEKPGLETPQKGVNCNFSLPEFGKPYGVRKLSISDAHVCSFSRIGRKMTKLQLFQFFGWKLRKISLDWALWCASRGIDNFSLSQLFGQNGNGKLSISWVEICIFQKDRT